MSEQDPDAALHYDRFGDDIRLRCRSMTDVETRCLIAGLWAGLDPETRLDIIRELSHYTDNPFSPMAPIALTVRQAAHDSAATDLPVTIDVTRFMRKPKEDF